MKTARLLLILPTAVLLAASLFGQAGAANTAQGAPPGQGEGWNDQPMHTPYQDLQRNPRLAERVQGLLPADTDLKQASRDFMYLDQFLAAVHVSNNLGIPLDQLRSKMKDSTFGQLRKAVETLKPGVDSKAEVKRADEQGKQDVKDAKKGG
ncbi:MAG TPA: hypothetical protein VE825_12960 [Terriglobales bacterium]|jgi:hypothetical protein|nr:hypothetical protein [Terriglobales bacterium]